MEFTTLTRTAGQVLAGCALGGALVVTAALAAEHAMLDTDGDGMVSYEELVAMAPEITEDEFAALDTDGSGGLDEEELVVAREAGLLPSEG